VIYGAYTGGVTDLLEDGLIPTVAVTWDTPDLNFAALVLSSRPERLRVLAYNFSTTAVRIGLRPWLLLPGTYVLTHGGKRGEGYRPIAWEESRILTSVRRGAPVPISVPSRKPWLIDLRLQQEDKTLRSSPDLAVHRRDVRTEGVDLVVTVHNLGAAAAGPFHIVVKADGGSGWSTVARTRVAGLPRIADFEPVRRPVRLCRAAVSKHTAPLRVLVDPENAVPETNELNNEVVLASRVRRRNE
jgi:hypothetical protein